MIISTLHVLNNNVVAAVLFSLTDLRDWNATLAERGTVCTAAHSLDQASSPLGPLPAKSPSKRHTNSLWAIHVGPFLHFKKRQRLPAASAQWSHQQVDPRLCSLWTLPQDGGVLPELWSFTGDMSAVNVDGYTALLLSASASSWTINCSPESTAARSCAIT